MITDDLAKFVSRWMRDAVRLDASKHPNSFDKFFRLFVAFNAMYSSAAAEEEAQERKECETCGSWPSGDKIASTTQLIRRLEPKNMRDYLRENYGMEINKLSELMTSGEFYIVSPNSKIDNNIITQLNNPNDANGFCLGVANLVYKTRCNMFHGEKHYKPNQARFLEPLCQVLVGIIDLLADSLNIPRNWSPK